MKKSLFLLLVALLIFSGCQNSWNKNEQEDNALNQAKAQVANYLNYTYQPEEVRKLARAENNDIYYYAADGKRYVFPNHDIFKSWFANYDINNIKIHNLETLYKTELGGNVTLRPGSLMMTETDPAIYLITGNGMMKTIENSELLVQLYGKNYNDYIIMIPNFYFTQYKNIGVITQAQEIPNIKADLTIDQDKGFK